MFKKIRQCFQPLCLVLLFSYSALEVGAQSAWINAGSGLWRESGNWSAGVPNSQTSNTLITNGGSKIITLDSASPDANLSIQRLIVSAPAGETNHLLLESLGNSRPLRLDSTALVNSGGVMDIKNSSIVLDGTGGGTLTVGGGAVVLQSGNVLLSNGARARIGFGSPGSLTMAGGTFLVNDELIVGSLTGGQGIVNLNGGRLETEAALVLGDHPGSEGTVTVQGGTLVAKSPNAVMRVGDDGTGVLTFLNGTGLLGNLSIGRSEGAQGTMTVAGGIVQAGEVSIGRFANATGKLVVTGGELLLPGGTLYVGREGSGDLLISGGRLVSQELLMVATSSASGQLRVEGGRLSLSNMMVGVTGGPVGRVIINDGLVESTNSAPAGGLTIASGDVAINGGVLEVDELNLANPGAILTFNGGILRTSGTRAQNNRPFVVGDGTRAATLHLAGGTHFFPHGLVISANAKITGCGEIIGQIDNRGVIATNCGGAFPAAPALLNPQVNGSAFTFSIQTEASRRYIVEYKMTLSDPGWTTLATYTGTGGEVLVTDQVSGSSRFYQARVE